ncbi:MAG: hypothetical protein O7A98_11870 [Acidobacteria bacterium]|nr:hypothetical protein [Acidobacteriota bacterium]
MSERSATEAEAVAIRAAVARLRAGIVAIVVGLFAGTGLAVATLWLVVRGGSNVGQHLALLRFYFPGYTVSVLGAFVGFSYAAALGAVVGWCTAWVYNRFAGYSSGR